ncbi:MAG: DNA ligase-associated DEXH box helicase, partial [Bremerella sp.]
ASGWMLVRGNRRRRNVDRGFVLSDHADWNGLLTAIDSSQAERVLLTHGQTAPMERYLREKGIEAASLNTLFTGEDDDLAVDTAVEDDSVEQEQNA